MLRDFEDTDDKSAWDQYEEAMDAYHKELTNRAVADAVNKQRAEDAEQHARQTAQNEWNRAASRFPDYNEVVANPAVKISAAMESVMRMDPEDGTALAYYLGQHPEESEQIARATLATNDREWTLALARAGKLLGQLQLKIGAAATRDSGRRPPAKAAEQPKPASKPQQKQPSRSNRPPAQLGGKAAPPQTNPASDEGAEDYAKWVTAREAQLKKR
jgi:hypothetical protein